MSSSFAVLALVPDGQSAKTQFLVVHSDNPAEALQVAAQDLVDEGYDQAQLVAVFQRADLEAVLAQLPA